MTVRSLPRLAPGARLEAHRTRNLTLVVNGPASEAATAPADTPSLRTADEPLSTAKSRWSRPASMVWLADMLVPERNSFGVLRLMMALAVLISHAVFLVTGQSSAEPLYRWTGYTLGQHGVQVFFFLSGILVAQSLMKSESVRDYAIARGLRIFPALIVCVLLTALVLGPWLSTLPAVAYLKDKLVAQYIVKTLSLMTGSAPLPGLFESAAGDAKGLVNSSLWTLKYEVLCYVMFAVIGWIAIRTKAYRTVAAAAIAGWLAIVLYQRVGIEIGSQKSAFEVLRYFALFFGAGTVAYVLSRWIPIHGLILVPLAAGLAASIGTRFAEPAMAVTLGYGALWLATFDFWGLRGYTNKSNYSYGTYIYGMPISQALLTLMPGIHVVSLTLITAGLVLMLAFLSWEIVERPALALRHRFRRRELPKPVVTVGIKQPEAAIRPSAVQDVMARVRGAVMTGKSSIREEKIATASSRPAAAPVTVPAQAPPAPAIIRQARDVPAKPAVVPEPGAARPWRPVSSPIRLQVATETRDLGGTSEAPPLADVPRTRIRFALNRKPSAPISNQVQSPTAVDQADIGQLPLRTRPRSMWRPIEPPSKPAP